MALYKSVYYYYYYYGLAAAANHRILRVFYSGRRTQYLGVVDDLGNHFSYSISRKKKQLFG